jgi:hypothetical protein
MQDPAAWHVHIFPTLTPPCWLICPWPVWCPLPLPRCSFDYDFRFYCIAILFAYIFFLRIAAVLALRYVNFLKRWKGQHKNAQTRSSFILQEFQNVDAEECVKSQVVLALLLAAECGASGRQSYLSLPTWLVSHENWLAGTGAYVNVRASLICRYVIYDMLV